MFSKFEGGIGNIIPKTKPMSIMELVDLIKNYPDAEKINKIRNLRKEGNQYFKVLKRTLTNVTPNCVVKKRDLKKNRNNFLYHSDYVFLDYDGMSDSYDFKNNFIKKYSNKIALTCISSSANGISVLVRVNADLNMDNFKFAWEYLAYEVFKDESKYIDKGTKDIGRAWYVSSDPDVFFNYDNIQHIPSEVLQTNNQGAKQCISEGGDNNTLKCTLELKLLDYSEVHGKIKLKTEVSTSNPVVDFNPIEYIAVRFPNVIKDGRKHKIYTLLIHYLVHLNPQLDSNYIYSFLYYINKSKADPPMEIKTFQRLFIHVYSITQQDDYKFESNRIKNFHINDELKLDKYEKLKLMNQLNGKLRRKNSIDKVIQAKIDLSKKNIDVTQKNVAGYSKLSLRTVKNYWHSDSIDIYSVTEDANDLYSSYISTTTTTTNDVHWDYNNGNDDQFWMDMDSLF